MAKEDQIRFVGAGGGFDDQPVGAVPVLVEKLQDPPVGVAGAVALIWNTNHWKYVPPVILVFPYNPTDSEFPP
jgi:hypothetical protein